MQITIQDETFTGEILHQQQLELSSPKVSIREIICERVKQEVERFNHKLSDQFYGLVQPLKSERNKLGFTLKKKEAIDAERQVYVALDAYQKNAFFVLVDDQQAESLDQLVEVGTDTKISFLQLTPLVGG